MIVTAQQHELKEWLCERIGLVATPALMCIGRENSEGRLMGVVGFDGYNGASFQMHSAGEGNWVSRDMLYACFHYPFVACDVSMLIGLVPSGNVHAAKFNAKLGFRTEYILQEAHPDGALLVMTMLRKDCRFLRKHHGQEIGTTSSARLH